MTRFAFGAKCGNPGSPGDSSAVATLPACSSEDPEVSIDDSLPVSAFGADSTAEEVTAGMDLSGRTALVTGCNSGLGFETMRVLALRGAHVIGIARTQTKADQACASVQGETFYLELVARYQRGFAGMPNHVREQATLTAQAIRTRSEPDPNR